ncbi:SCO family protein [Aquabacter spiritensis]|uniref:Protein SCO1/2 n=1 Tax=Aquabacter spiritensis TaxID=933073 RepID=A0A4R3LYY8_9HYPH|nr:SCO family protein [Aquabacter spiritensis]TCT05079.1 protein SCO1/2 [Aquabacter spiritensis]
MSSRAKIIALFAIFACGALLLVGVATALLPARQTAATAGASVGGPFTLVDQDGKTVTEADLKGRPSLIFFGFTHCPDICPTALFEMSEILNALGPDAQKLQIFFVTVDPERDTPDTLKAYISSFHPQLKALTGTPPEVDAIKRAYRVYSKKVPLDAGGYTMDHTAVIYLMDKSGAFLAPFNAKQPPDQAAVELRRYL